MEAKFLLFQLLRSSSCYSLLSYIQLLLERPPELLYHLSQFIHFLTQPGNFRLQFQDPLILRHNPNPCRFRRGFVLQVLVIAVPVALAGALVFDEVFG